MKRNVCAAFALSLGVGLAFASSQAVGDVWSGHGGISGAKHSPFNRSHHNHHHRRNLGAFLPTTGGFFWGPQNSGVTVDSYAAPVADYRFTCTYDIPWDWVHRCPPLAGPPETPLIPVARVPACVPQAVTVPGADGKDQTITMVRC